MPGYSKIAAIKLLRERTGLALKDAKEIVEEIEGYITMNIERYSSLQSSLDAAEAKAKCYQDDLHQAMRLVGYFVKHPAEFEAFEQECLSTD